MRVATTEVVQIGKSYLEMVALLLMGIDVKIGASSYLFSGLNDLKPDMLR